MKTSATGFRFLILIAEILLLSVPTGRAEPSNSEVSETLDDPPAYIFPAEVSPAMISQHGPFTSVQINVDANNQNIQGDAANEPSLCVDPQLSNQLAVGWRQFNTTTSNFRQAGSAYSNDSGAFWIANSPLDGTFRSDPVLASDASGTFFYLSLFTTPGSVSKPAMQVPMTEMWSSLDFGTSWLPLATANGGDKPWFTVDTTNSVGRGFQYQFWNSRGNPSARTFSRSIDGGFTWSNPIRIPNGLSYGTLDVDTKGNLFIGGAQVNENDGTQAIFCVRSRNARDGQQTPKFDPPTPVNLGGNILFGHQQPINEGGSTGQVYLAIDRSGTTTNNYIYMLASVQPPDTDGGTEVMFVRSTDGGNTFSDPVPINDDADSAKWHWFGTLSVAPDGRIDAVWLDTRNAANNTDSQLFYSYSTDGGDKWSSNVSISESFDPLQGYPNNDPKMGDYISMVSDANGANVVYTATFNKDMNGEPEEDIYYTRINLISVGLVAFYPFNGNANDESGNGHDGVPTDATLVADRFGNPDSAFRFNGTSSYIQVPDSPDLDLTEDFTIAAWVRRDRNATVDLFDIVAKHIAGPNDDGSWVLRLDQGPPEGRVLFQATPDFTGFAPHSNSAVRPGVWTHTAFTYEHDTGNWVIYLNGKRNAAGTEQFSIQHTGIDLLIGAEFHYGHVPPYYWFFHGVLDEIRLYNRTLSAAEIKAISGL
jgi:hypothetical protein